MPDKPELLIVAELGVNHLGDPKRMLELINAAADSGAGAIKLQAYQTDRLIADREKLGRSTPSDAEELLRQSELTDAMLSQAIVECARRNIKWFASVFDPTQIDRCLKLGACALKLSHVEATNMSLWQDCADAARQWEVPFWWSTNNRKYRNAVGAVWCVNQYPADAISPELGLLAARAERSTDAPGFGFSGFSSHYTDWRVPALAGLTGIEYLEVHFALAMSDPEAGWSLNPTDFRQMVEFINHGRQLFRVMT